MESQGEGGTGGENEAVRYLLIASGPDERRRRPIVSVYADADEARQRFRQLESGGGRAELAAVDACGRVVMLCSSGAPSHC